VFIAWVIETGKQTPCLYQQHRKKFLAGINNRGTHVLHVSHCKKRFMVFPSPAGMSLAKLSLIGNNLPSPRKVWSKKIQESRTFFLQCSNTSTNFLAGINNTDTYFLQVSTTTVQISCRYQQH